MVPAVKKGNNDPNFFLETHFLFLLFILPSFKIFLSFHFLFYIRTLIIDLERYRVGKDSFVIIAEEKYFRRKINKILITVVNGK